MIRVKYVWLTIAICCGLHLHAQFDPELAAELEAILEEQIAGANHGVAASVILENGEEWNGWAGDDGAGDPITASTVFYGASSTKLHVAICLLQMVEEELIYLDDSWDSYVSLNVNIDPTITVRQLLSHISGIADYLETASASGYILNDPEYAFSPQEIMEDIVSSDPVFPAGTDLQYSNSNYVMLGLIVEAVSGNDLFTELRNRIWDPLELTHTYGGGHESFTEPTAGVWWNFGEGFNNYSDMSHSAMLSFAYGAGGIVTTPKDQAHLLEALFDGELLDPSSMDLMMDFVPESFDDWPAGYGLGLHHAINTGSDEVLGHDGYYANMSSTFHSTSYGFTLTTAINTQSAWYGVFAPLYDALVNHLETGVNDTFIATEIRLFPNPATNQIQVEGVNSQTKISIVSSQGQMLIQTELPANGVIDLSELSSGIYTLHLSTKEGDYRRRLIILH